MWVSPESEHSGCLEPARVYLSFQVNVQLAAKSYCVPPLLLILWVLSWNYRPHYPIVSIPGAFHLHLHVTFLMIHTNCFPAMFGMFGMSLLFFNVCCLNRPEILTAIIYYYLLLPLVSSNIILLFFRLEDNCECFAQLAQNVGRSHVADIFLYSCICSASFAVVHGSSPIQMY